MEMTELRRRDLRSFHALLVAAEFPAFDMVNEEGYHRDVPNLRVH